MLNVEEALSHVERLYRSLTGRDAPPSEGPYAPIPPERDPVQHIELQLNRLLEALGPGVGVIGGLAPVAPVATWIPPVTIAESASELVVYVDLPGMQREAVDVAIDPAAIVVSGQRPAPTTEPARALVGRANERMFGPFRRVVALPPGVVVDQASATLRDGVLEIRVARAPASPGGQRLQVS